MNKVSLDQALFSSNEMTLLEFVVHSSEDDVHAFLKKWPTQPSLWRKSLLDTVMAGLLSRCTWQDYSFLLPEEWNNLFLDSFLRYHYQHQSRFFDQLKYVHPSVISSMLEHPHKQYMIEDTIVCLALLERFDVAEDFLRIYQGQYQKDLVGKPFWPYKEQILSFVCRHQQAFGYSSSEWASVVLLKMVCGFGTAQQGKKIDTWCWDMWQMCDERDQEDAILQWVNNEQHKELPLQVIESLTPSQLQGLTRYGDQWTRQERHFLLYQRMENSLTKEALQEACLVLMDEKEGREGKRM